MLLSYALFFTGEDSRDTDFVPDDFAKYVLQPREREPQRGKAATAEKGSSSGRTKRSAKRKKLTAPRVDDAEFDEDIVPDEIPASNIKVCALKFWTQLRQTNPYRFAEPQYPEDPHFWIRSQFVMWTQFYQDLPMTSFVKPLRVNLSFLKMHMKADLKYV